MTFALLPQFCQLVWLGVAVEREGQARGTQNEQMRFPVIQPFLSFDLVGSLPRIRSPTQIHCHSIRLHQCHSIGSERLGLPPELGHVVVKHRSWIGLCTTTTCVTCFMTSIFCTAFSPRFSASIGPSWTPSGLGGSGTAAGASAPASGSLPSSRGKLLRYVVVKRAFPSSDLAISTSSCVRQPSECPRAHFRDIGTPGILQSVYVSRCQSALLMYRRRPFPIASASAIAAGELT